MSEIWQLLTQSPETFRGGDIWEMILTIHDALIGIGYGLLVLFFAVGVVKTCSSYADMKRPEMAVKMFVRFALAKGAIGYGLELMMALFTIIQGVVSTIMSSSGLDGSSQALTIPEEMVESIENVGLLDSIPLWIVTLLGSLLITVLSFIMILTVYGRMFKLYMYTALAPVPLATFAGEPTQNIGKNFVHSYAGVCLEGAIIALWNSANSRRQPMDGQDMEIRSMYPMCRDTIPEGICLQACSEISRL
ncbi:VirB6/TrbL-like conjugal transfer protein, CD1112 family [Mediterraneibacter glycyrrhizinilyticus]|uniref:VirB6/TrbL-like conjugal transfer protein, CD1112 family n=1 Tax=Mediterraneibacter glycyrrhizinilyticus TaxID=342942 RepID=UPI001FAF9EFB|nr:CD0415/CD1112 family protein [Mediterraneibacter glycyrrhizinilyticus]